jgi:hypothetical protein
MRTDRCLAVLLTLLAVVVSPTIPQEKEPPAIAARSQTPVVIHRLSRPVTFDGLSHEEAWTDIPVLPMVMMRPHFGFPPSEKTEVLIGFDDRYLWVAGRLYDSEPSRMLSSSKKRDYMEPNTEFFGVIFDTFNDKENGLGFMTTPTGLRWDAAIYNDAVSATPMEMPVNSSWNTFWDVEVVRNDQGWFVEMRIPFSSIRFQEADGRVVMGLLVYRWIPRKNEEIVFPAIPPRWGFLSAWKPSQAQEIVLEGVRSHDPLYIAPYVLGGSGYDFSLNDAETAYQRTRQPTAEVGLDVKYGLTSNLTLDVTVNPDFAQVEADDQQINLTRFSLFFPEKRLFFQERGSVFDFSFGDFNQLFYSRRIGLYEDEEEEESRVVPIYGGVRMVGRAGSWDLGFMDMQTAPLKEEGVPAENFGILRLRRRVFNPYSYVGGMITSRIGTDGSYNEAYGLDAIIRIAGDDYVTFNWAQTFENGRANDPASLDPSRLRITWEKRTQEGFGSYLGLSRSGRDYNPGMGFEMRENFTAGQVRLLYGWLPGEKSFLQSHNISAGGYAFFRNEDNTLESAEAGPGWEFSTKSGFNGQFSLKAYYESFLEIFELSDDCEVPPGDYTFYGLESYLMTPMGKAISGMMILRAGSFYDGRRISIGLRPSWGLTPDLTLSGMYEYNRIEFPDRNQGFTAHLLQARLLATPSIKFSILTFIQYNSADDLVIGNVRFRYNPREGIDLYLVYNEVLNTDRPGKIPAPPLSGSRAVLLKYSYTFNL